MLVLDPQQIGRGWIEIRFQDNPAHPDCGKTPYIRTLDQYYFEGQWKTGSMFTSEKYAYQGKIPYRRPACFRAYLTAIFPGWFVKVWRRKVAGLFERNSG